MQKEKKLPVNFKRSNNYYVLERDNVHLQTNKWGEKPNTTFNRIWMGQGQIKDK